MSDVIAREIASEFAGTPHATHVRSELLALGGPRGWGARFGEHSRSFRFASLLFPRDLRPLISGVYLFCRFADDLVDRPSAPSSERIRAHLATLHELSLAAWEGRTTVPLLDVVFGESRRRGVGHRWAAELIRGVEMDLDRRVYRSLDELRLYTFRVASVVGGWITELVGESRAEVLDRAFALGHAMQLTNIVRDVGEDAAAGRLYLPLDLMERHGVQRDEIDRVRLDPARALPRGLPDLLEALMEAAESDYDAAFDAIPELPEYAQRPIAVAASVYHGIHAAVRANGYDTIRERAFTSRWEKVTLARRGLRRLASVRTRGPRR